MVYSTPTTQTAQQKEETRQGWRDTFDIYNKHYELWGRQVELVFVEGSGTDTVAQRADAVRVATEIRPFLSTTGAQSAQIYSTEVAARGVIALDIPAPWKSTQQQAPFRWGAYQDERATILHITEYVGKRLSGRPTRWAGDATLNTGQRVFGLGFPDSWDRTFFDAEAARQSFQVAEAFSYREDDTVGAQERARILISRMKEHDITSVIAGTGVIFTIVLTREATTQLYFPEWIVTGWNNQDATIFGRLFDQEQWQHAFGLGAISVLPPASKNWYYANYEWHHGRSPPSSQSGAVATAATIAWQASIGLQGAGPNLNPQTFRDAMFAFPPTGGVHCDCRSTLGLSFGRHIASMPWDDHTGWDDMTEKWWDPNYRTQDELGIEGLGAYLKVDLGRRYLPGGWPNTEPRAFDRRDTVEHVDDWPLREAPPPYEHQPH